MRAFNETSGTTATDALGDSDGTLWSFPVDDSQWSCRHGGSLIFDGVDDYVTLTDEDDFDFTDSVTVAVWIKVTSFSIDEQAVVTKGDTAWRLERNGSTNTLQFSVEGLMTNTEVQGSVSVNDGNWHHVAGVYDGAQLLLYVDGQLDAAVTATGPMSLNNSAVSFGANTQAAGRNFHGLMDDIYIYDTPLTALEIQALALDSMAGWWKLDESAGTVAYDNSTFGNNGNLQSMSGTEWTVGKVEGGLEFDGSSDYIEVSNSTSLQFTNAITIAAWIKGDSWGSASDVDVIARKGGSTPVNYQLCINDGEVSLHLDDTDGGGGYRSDTTLNTDEWYHVAATWDGSEVRIYVNGVLDNTPESHTSSLGSDTRSLYIGGRVGQDRFDGLLDDVRLYNRALCADEIAAIYKQIQGVQLVQWREIDPQ